MPRVGVGVVIFINGKLLLVKRRQAPAAGRWTLPGGLVEIGESLQSAIKREVAEELGIQIEIDRLIDTLDYIQKDAAGNVEYHYVLVDYLAYVTSGTLRAGSDVQEYKLIAWEELENIDIPEFTRTFLRQHEEAFFADFLS